MKRPLRLMLGLFSAAYLLWPGWAFSSPNGELHRSLERLIASSCAAKSAPGIGALSLNDNRFILKMNLEKLYTPASNVKIITSLTALKKLKPDYTFKSIFYLGGALKEGVVHGDLYIKGLGDPDLIPEQVWRMAVELRDSGVHTVEGDLVADGSFFDDQLRGPGWNARWSARAYHAPISALSVNFNTVAIKILPGEGAGSKAAVYIDPKTRYIRLKNLTTTLPSGSRSTIMVSRTPLANGDLITVKGGIPGKSAGEHHRLNISKPALYAATLFHNIMFNEGVVVAGKPRVGKTPATAVKHLVHESRPLSLIVWGLNKYSNNFVAEQILKTMGAELRDPPGTLAKGLEIVQEYMEEIGIEPGNYKLVDGSGLSADNRLSPAQIIWALRRAYRDFELSPEFIASLSVMGVDGSVSKRLLESPAHRKVRAKTGSLNGVAALSGYLRTLRLGTVAFSVLLNGGRCNYHRAKDLQDRILLLLIDASNPVE